MHSVLHCFTIIQQPIINYFAYTTITTAQDIVQMFYVKTFPSFFGVCVCVCVCVELISVTLYFTVSLLHITCSYYTNNSKKNIITCNNHKPNPVPLPHFSKYKVLILLSS